MAQKGTPIYQSAHLDNPSPDVKIPVSDGSGKRLHITIEDIKAYMEPEYAPHWYDATAYLSPINGFSSVMEIGSPQPTVDDFAASGSPARASSSAGSATGGAPTDTITVETKGNTTTASLSREYAEGTVRVSTSKGIPTLRTAANDTTIVDKAGINSNINPATYFIKAITKTATLVINYVYALYANKSDITQSSALPLTAGTSVEIDFPAETATSKHYFDLPSAYSLIKIEVWNSNASRYEAYTTQNFLRLAVIHKDASGKNVSYTRYMRKDGTNGATKFKITFTK